jgi:hypothetical protein
MKRWVWIWNTAVLVTGAAALGWYLWRLRAEEVGADRTVKCRRRIAAGAVTAPA